MVSNPASALHEFKISVSPSGLSPYSLAEALGKNVSTSAKFIVEQLDGSGMPHEIRLDLFGENLNRAVRLSRSGSTIVKPEFKQQTRHDFSWLEYLVDMALNQFATVPLGRTLSNSEPCSPKLGLP
jgi:hypothetical protein